MQQSRHNELFQSPLFQEPLGRSNMPYAYGLYDSTTIHEQDQPERSSARQDLVSGLSTFSVAGDQSRERKRAKFTDPKRRGEVAKVRKDGACLRCRWNKIPVCSLPHHDHLRYTTD